MKIKNVCTVILCLIMTVTLCSCGKKGGPFPPEGQESKYPRQYPSSE